MIDGGKLKRIRSERGMSQIDLSKQSGISQDTLCLWEKNRGKNPRSENIAAVAKVLNCDPSEFVTDLKPDEFTALMPHDLGEGDWRMMLNRDMLALDRISRLVTVVFAHVLAGGGSIDAAYHAAKAWVTMERLRKAGGARTSNKKSGGKSGENVSP